MVLYHNSILIWGKIKQLICSRAKECLGLWPHLIILQRGPRKSAVKGAVAHKLLFSALSFESRSSPVSKLKHHMQYWNSYWVVPSGSFFIAQHKAGLLHLRGASGQPGSFYRAHLLLSCFCSLRTLRGPVLLHFQLTCLSWWWDRHQRSCGAACELCLPWGVSRGRGEHPLVCRLAPAPVLLSCGL